jgi:hypothetical protein
MCFTVESAIVERDRIAVSLFGSDTHGGTFALGSESMPPTGKHIAV